MRGLAAIIIGTSIVLPFGASAQMSDADYCNALSKVYRETVALNSTPDATGPVAMSQCASSPATAIPTLEKILTDNKVTLPKRT